MPVYSPYYTYYNPFQYVNSGSPYYPVTAPVVTQQSQPVQQQIPVGQNISQALPQFSNVWFNGTENDARMYPVGPNNAVALWCENEPVIYLKKADMAGKPEFTILDIKERKTAEMTSEPDKDSPKFVTEEAMSSLLDAVKELSNTVGKMQSDNNELFGSLSRDIETMKSDMYGIAGKKPAAKKVEVKDE